MAFENDYTQESAASSAIAYEKPILNSPAIKGNVYIDSTAQSEIAEHISGKIFALARDIQVVAATTGGTRVVVPVASQTRIVLNNAGTLATYTVTLPTAPVDGQEVGISAKGAITSLTINSADGTATINGAVITLAANGAVRYVYSSAQNAWYVA